MNNWNSGSSHLCANTTFLYGISIWCLLNWRPHPGVDPWRSSFGKGKPRQSNSKLTGQPGACYVLSRCRCSWGKFGELSPSDHRGTRGRQCKGPDLCSPVPETNGSKGGSCWDDTRYYSFQLSSHRSQRKLICYLWLILKHLEYGALYIILFIPQSSFWWWGPHCRRDIIMGYICATPKQYIDLVFIWSCTQGLCIISYLRSFYKNCVKRPSLLQ